MDPSSLTDIPPPPQPSTTPCNVSSPCDVSSLTSLTTPDDTTIQIDTITTPNKLTKINVAVIGCVHGELDRMYETIKNYEKNNKQRVHLVLCCGDFQSMRNQSDLQCLACPPKYRQMIDFYRYYNGEKVAPILTLFTHGNHEASNYLMELPYGGWVANNIYYLGFASVVTFFGITIASVGGIYKYSYKLPRTESCPLNENTMRSLYHTRNYDVWLMSQYQRPVDFAMSHDWPHDAPHHGDLARLLKLKPDFQQDIATGKLGSRPFSRLLSQMRPNYWFSAHLHCKYVAVYNHEQQVTNVHHTAQLPSDRVDGNVTTRFIALDKIIPGRQFMQIIPYHTQLEPSFPKPTQTHQNDENSVESVTNIKNYINFKTISNEDMIQHFCVDPDWVQIVQLSQPLHPRAEGLQFRPRPVLEYTPENHRQYYGQYNGKLCDCIVESKTRADLFCEEMLDTPNTYQHYQIPSNFQQTALPTISGHTDPSIELPQFLINPQTIGFCNRYKILIPTFWPHTQWCSPKHAQYLYREQCENLQS